MLRIVRKSEGADRSLEISYIVALADRCELIYDLPGE